MQRDPRAFLWDVRDAADAIMKFVGDTDFDGYIANRMLHSAVERKLEIIGEALNQLSKAEPVLAARIPELPKIVAFRNLLIHGYAVIDHSRVWRIVIESLPTLREMAATLLDEMGEA